MNFKLVLATLALSLTTLSAPAMAADATEAIKAAKESQKEVSAAGFEWRDTGKLIKKAEKLAKEGKAKKAMALANNIIMRNKAGLTQAALAKSAGPRH